MLSTDIIPKVDLDTEHLHIYIERINDSVESDPSLAIGSTKDLIEATLKTILHGCSFKYDKKDDIPKLLKKVQKVLYFQNFASEWQKLRHLEPKKYRLVKLNR